MQSLVYHMLILDIQNIHQYMDLRHRPNASFASAMVLVEVKIVQQAHLLGHRRFHCNCQEQEDLQVKTLEDAFKDVVIREEWEWYVFLINNSKRTNYDKAIYY